MVKIYSVYLLAIVCVVGILYGIRQFRHPEKIVNKRYARHQKLAVETGDMEFQHWLKKEFNAQVKKTKRVGLLLASFETLFLLVVVYYLTNV